ncbi:hypothetical protein GHT06_001527 [Daphnia sinensis]|uniref:B box-type domain-containing protein n=1 Tax=Daphnia sinensis TaxID=1820382 RepID=A0AAD5KUS7_9CRUS|nr:hypothetical protein GHT06_001527 [Daphnia sinensis]
MEKKGIEVNTIRKRCYASKDEKHKRKAIRRPNSDANFLKGTSDQGETANLPPSCTPALGDCDHSSRELTTDFEYPIRLVQPVSSQVKQISNVIEHKIEPELLAVLQEYEDRHIPDKLRTAPTSATEAAAKYKAEETDWKERQRAQDRAFSCVRESDRNKVVAEALEIFNGICNHCRNVKGIVVCHTCHALLCPACDSTFHFNHITHDRVILQGVKYKLKSNQHVDLLGKVQNRCVPVPIFEPGSCPCCLTVGSMRIQCGPDEISVVTTKGREDGFSSPEFECRICHFIKKPSSADYMKSDYWPGTLPNISSLIHGSALREWQFLMFQAPGTSQGKYITVLDEIAYLNDRDTKINRTHFNRASHEFKYFHYKIEKDILHRHGRCKACGSCPLGYHCDGNRKLYRLKSAKDRDGESLYGNDIIEDDKDQLVHTLKLEAKLGKPSVETCGASNFQALRSENSKAKNLDITGIVMMTCTHGATVRITKMKRGESFSLTHMMHMKAEQMNVKFFCSDVVCKYSKWAVKVGNRFPEYKSLTVTIKWFLSRFHGLVHGWGCRVLFNGHWNEGAADFIGEEGEQAFSIYSRFANSLKHTSSFVYNNNLSSFSFSRNTYVEKGMVDSLCKWLDALLEEKGLTFSQLPGIMEQLKQQASIMEDSSKARSVEHHKMTQKKARIDKIIDRLNEKGVIVTQQHLESGVFPWHADARGRLRRAHVNSINKLL